MLTRIEFSKTGHPVKINIAPQLEATILDFTCEGDTIVVHSMVRLARKLDDLQRIVQTLTERGICIDFKTEKLISILYYQNWAHSGEFLKTTIYL